MTHRCVFNTTGAVLLAVTLALPAQATDVRSWDRKISDPANRFVVLGAFNKEAVLDKETQLVW